MFGYEGSPSWVFVVVSTPTGSGTYTVEVTTHDGRRLPLGTLTMTDGKGSFGQALPGALRDIAHLRLVHPDGATGFQAAFRRPSPDRQVACSVTGPRPDLRGDRGNDPEPVARPLILPGRCVQSKHCTVRLS